MPPQASVTCHCLGCPTIVAVWDESQQRYIVPPGRPVYMLRPPTDKFPPAALCEAHYLAGKKELH